MARPVPELVFFVLSDDQYFLVTARHVIDPKYRPEPIRREATCTEVRMFFYVAANPGTEKAEVRYKNLRATDPDWTFCDADLDLATMDIPPDELPFTFDNGDIIRPISFPASMIASEEILQTRIAGEPIVFYGFPRYSPNKILENGEFHYPILRQGVFAFPPTHGITIECTLGTDYGLIDSFAQSGFSGGPIVSLQKGWSDGTMHPIDQYKPAKLVGLMCGHYRHSEDRSDGAHSGLSYFARSSAIARTIEKAKPE